MNEEKNRERMQILSHDIQKMGKIKKIESKMFDYYGYNDYLKKYVNTIYDLFCKIIIMKKLMINMIINQ